MRNALRRSLDATPTLLLDDDPWHVRLLRAVRTARRKVRHALCPLINGGHELYRARSDSRLFQECLLCGYDTPGWTIDRRDRKLHLVTKKTGTRG